MKLHLQYLRGQYPDATHHCYGYVIHPDSSAQRSNDDGEPSNSAGRPILRQIEAAGLTNTLVVVVRYFGGTMLGIPGLIHAYGECAKRTLENTKTEEKYIEEMFEISGAFELENEIHRFIHSCEARILGSEYSTNVVVRIAVRKNRLAAMDHALKEFYLLRSIRIPG